MLAGCSPKYNWRDYSSPDGHYQALFPGKPASFTREVDLDGMKVSMTMTAAEVDGTTFAVGSAVAPDPAHAQAALAAMKTALARNIGASITDAKPAAGTADIDATGSRNGVPTRLVGHFAANGNRFYQVIVLGKASAIEQEQVEQFISSFKPQ